MVLLQNISELSAQELIERFENNIIYDCHCYLARFERSQAREELCLRGKQVLSNIVDHLKLNPPQDEDLQTAWGQLLNTIESSIDPNKSGPHKLKNTKGWINWAEKFA